MKSLKRRLIALRSALYRAMMRAAGALLPLDRHKTVYMSFGGHAYSDNPRAVSEAMSALDPQARPVWLFTDPNKPRPDMPQNVIPVRAHSLRAVYHMATASCWVLNHLMPPYLVKRRGQCYVQTWHGDRTFKVVLHESGKRGIPDLDVMDLGVVGSDQGETIFRDMFGYKGELLRVGSPRNDALIHLDDQEAARIRRAVGIGEDERVAMYAPTMREHLAHTQRRQDVQALDFKRLLDLLEQRDGLSWRLIVRAHSTVSGLGGYAADARILDLSGYEDMRDLLQICDLLLTDYSSSACDFPLTGRPVVLFQPDIDEYRARDRALCFKMEDSPFHAARSQAELEDILLSIDEDGARENARAIEQFFGIDETGEAAKRVAEWILSKGASI